jgi:hypothetical protein
MSKNHKNNPYRQIYIENYGDIPEGYHIHHIDGNPLNNDPKNLIAISAEEHAKIHNHEFVKWASEGGKIGGRKTVEEKLGWHNPNVTRKGTPQPEGHSELRRKQMLEEYSSGKRVHWSTLYTPEEVSAKISAGDPGKSNRGKPAWNLGKKFKNTEEAKENKRKAALLREQRKREAKILQENKI